MLLHHHHHYFLCENNLFFGIPYATNCGMNSKMMFSFWWHHEYWHIHLVKRAHNWIRSVCCLALCQVNQLVTLYTYHACTIVNKITNKEHKYTKCIQYYNPPKTDTQQCTQTYSTASIIRTNWDQGSSVNQTVQIIKHKWQYYNTFM